MERSTWATLAILTALGLAIGAFAIRDRAGTPAAGPDAASDAAPEPPRDTVVARLLGGAPHRLGLGQSWLLTAVDEEPSYGAVVLPIREDRYLLFDSMTAMIDGRAQWRVIDAFRLPALEPGEIVRGGGCFRDGDPDRRVAAILLPSPDDGPVHENVRRAWIADLPERRFTDIEPDGVACENNAFGL